MAAPARRECHCDALVLYHRQSQHAEVYGINHSDSVSAEAGDETEAVFAAMDRHLTHMPWRVFHTDCPTPEAFLARLALDFAERFVAVQMALE
jgi:hypothetical protein